MIRQLYNLLLLMTISIMTLAPFACVDDPRNPPPPPGGSSASNGETGNNDSTGLEPRWLIQRLP